MAQDAKKIREELILFGLSDLDNLISETMDDARRQPGKRQRTPQSELVVFLYDALVDVRQDAERLIAVLADREAEAQKRAEQDEADLSVRSIREGV